MSALRRLRVAGVTTLLCLVVGCGGGTLAIDAGEDQERLLGATVEFEAIAPDGEVTSFEWSVLSQPAGAQAGLESQGSRASLTPTLPGPYELSVTATSGKAEGTDTVRLTVLPNSRPVADAGPDRVVSLGEHIELDGRGSHDPDPQELAFFWSVVSAPANSLASFSEPTSRTPSFAADVPGSYTLELAVHDGGFTVTDQVMLVTNREPVADAGPDLFGQVGQPLILDGSGSIDPDDDPLTFAWTLVSTPTASVAVIANGADVQAHLTPDLPGSYLVDLTVFDGRLTHAARINVQVLPPSGVAGSVVYVSPSGNDTHPGTEALPLATIATALTKVQETEQLYRIQLAAGEYAEAFGHLLQNLTVEIIGPESAEATLVGTANLFELSGSSRLTLLQVTLETPGIAVIGKGSGVHVGMTNVDCVSRTCIQSGQLGGAGGGTVHVHDSRLRGHGEGVGVTQAFGQVSVRDTEIEGHATGISSVDGRLLVRDSVLRDNVTGITLFANTSALPILVDNVAISGSEVGISTLATTNVQIVGGSITDGDFGLKVTGGAVSLRSLTVSQMQTTGLDVGGIANTGELVTVRDSHFTSIAGPTLMVNHPKSVLDLGSEAQPGNNQLGSSLDRAIWDMRPAGATGSITLSHTTLNGQPIPVGTSTGPSNVGAFTIVGAGNTIHVY